LPADLTWLFVWTAEIVVDEFRCELATYEARLGYDEMMSNPADYSGIVAVFETALDDFRQTGDLMDAFQRSSAALQRLGQFLAYGAANIVFDPAVESDWSSVSPMTNLHKI